jgi:hypothetical protein
LALAKRDPYIGIVQFKSPRKETTVPNASRPSSPPRGGSSAGNSVSTADLFGRIDEMTMNAHDRERAKATLEIAERVADWLVYVATKLKSPTARIARPSMRRSTLRNSPAHR